MVIPVICSHLHPHSEAADVQLHCGRASEVLLVLLGWKLFQSDHRTFAKCRIAPSHPLPLHSLSSPPTSSQQSCSPLPGKAPSSGALALHRKGCHCPSVASLLIPKAILFLDCLSGSSVLRCTLYSYLLAFFEFL